MADGPGAPLARARRAVAASPARKPGPDGLHDLAQAERPGHVDCGDRETDQDRDPDHQIGQAPEWMVRNVAEDLPDGDGDHYRAGPDRVPLAPGQALLQLDDARDQQE